MYCFTSREGNTNVSRSLSAAVVRLLIETEIMNGGYAAHTDVNRKAIPY
jgi:hypothetical protein